MAAGQGFKTFTTGEVLTAGDVNGYLMQGINVFADATARDAAITAPAEGQFAYTRDNNSLWYYTGSAWAASGATGDIEGVTAGVGISGGGTSGTVTVTNSMATAIDAKGDLVPGTGADTFSRLAVGANDTVLTADSAQATGLKWAAPINPALRLVKARTTFTAVANTGTTFDSVFTSAYRNYKVVIDSLDSSSNPQLNLVYRYGSTSQTSTYNGATMQLFFNGTYSNLLASGAASAPIVATLSGYATGGAVEITFFNAGNGTTSMPITFSGFCINGNNAFGAMGNATTRAYDGFQLQASSGTITGSVTIYGMVTS
jgi:trimeric autotransporter adhesin